MKIIQQPLPETLLHEGLKLHCKCGTIVELERADKYEAVRNSFVIDQEKRSAKFHVACPYCSLPLLFSITNDGQTVSAESLEPSTAAA